MKVEEAITQIREELDDHLDTLNQNTTELSAAYEHVCEIDARLEKLTERVDALQALLLSQNPITQATQETKKITLTQKERGVMQVLRNAAGPITSAGIGKLVGLTPDLAAQTLYCMSQKKIPILILTEGEQTQYLLKEDITSNDNKLQI